MVRVHPTTDTTRIRTNRTSKKMVRIDSPCESEHNNT